MSTRATFGTRTKYHHQAVLLVPMATNRLPTRDDTHVLSAIVEVVGTKAGYMERVLRAFDIVGPPFWKNESTDMH